MEVDPTSGEVTYEGSHSEVDAGQIPDEADAKLITSIFGGNGRRNDTPVISGPPLHDEVYPMVHQRRGLALIFNHWEYKDKNMKRAGARVDQDNLEKAFKSLGFQIEVCENNTQAQIQSKLFEVSRMDHSDADCLVVVVMTHGKSAELYAFDDTYPEDLLWTYFTGNNCLTLAGKPKLFFIQACRGQNVDDGVKLSASQTQADGRPPQKVTYTIPETADLLIAHATFDGYFAWRNAESGSWFIQALCAELHQHGTEYDILRLMTAVNRRVAVSYESVAYKKEMDKKKQMSTVLSTLTRLLYFKPKN